MKLKWIRRDIHLVNPDPTVQAEYRMLIMADLTFTDFLRDSQT